MFTLFLITFLITVLAFVYLTKSGASAPDPDQYSSTPKEKQVTTVVRKNISHDSANVMTSTGPDNTCVAIFKNPWDRMTHFYRTRLKGNLCPFLFEKFWAAFSYDFSKRFHLFTEPQRCVEWQFSFLLHNNSQSKWNSTLDKRKKPRVSMMFPIYLDW